MKPLIITTILSLALITSVKAANFLPDTNKTAKIVYAAPETMPEYPGGVSAFSTYISRNVKYPEVARLIGINGKVLVSFIIEKDGQISNVTPVNCLGAGCESEAARVVSLSLPWKPGIKNGKAVRVKYMVPISFNIEDSDKVLMKQLKASNYGFVFNIKGSLYNLDEAQSILGRSFMPSQVETAEPFYNADNDQKFLMPDKKEVYIIKIKS